MIQHNTMMIFYLVKDNCQKSRSYSIGFGTMIMGRNYFAKNLIQRILMELLPNDKTSPLKVMESELENV